mgnify:FL=1
MKTTKFLSALLLVSACVSCSQYDTYDPYVNNVTIRPEKIDQYDLSTELSSNSYLPQDVAFALSLKYIDVYDDLYLLKMTPEDAKDLKIDPEDYEIIKQSVYETNKVLAKEGIPADMAPIEEAIKKFFSGNSDDIINLKPMRSYGEVSGYVPIPDNAGFYTTSMFIPSECRYITVTCSSQAPLGMCIVKIYYAGESVATRTVMTPLGISNSCTIEVPVSNAWITVGVMASSTGGGYFTCRLGE